MNINYAFYQEYILNRNKQLKTKEKGAETQAARDVQGLSTATKILFMVSQKGKRFHFVILLTPVPSGRAV
jgi:hypothetical protein